MRTYLPKMATLQLSQGIWCVEAAWMDQISEAYYLGGDFDGRNDCFFYYMVWHDQDIDVYNVGCNLYGQPDVPFSKMRCAVTARRKSLREALECAEEMALARLQTTTGAGRTLGGEQRMDTATMDEPGIISRLSGTFDPATEYHPASLQ